MLGNAIPSVSQGAWISATKQETLGLPCRPSVSLATRIVRLRPTVLLSGKASSSGCCGRCRTGAGSYPVTETLRVGAEAAPVRVVDDPARPA
jgi:hypothetical protein